MSKSYMDIINEVGEEFADAVLMEEYNQFTSYQERAAAPFYPFSTEDEYPGYIEFLGCRKVRANNEKLYRMEEKF